MQSLGIIMTAATYFLLLFVSIVLLGCNVNIIFAQTSNLGDQNRRFSTTV